MDNMKHRRLQELDRSDFGIVEGEPDIRGWDVRLSSGDKVGEVEELILDAQKRKVRYMVVDRGSNDLDLQEFKVLIPIGLAQLDQDDDDVVLPGVKVDQLKALPSYDADHLDDKMEQMTCIALGRNNETAEKTSGDRQRNAVIVEHDDKFYENDYFNDKNLYKNRMNEAQPVSSDKDYDHGLRLWEIRNEGGDLPDNTRFDDRNRAMNEEQRMEMIRNRRKSYEDRRGYRSNTGNDRYRDNERRDNSISARIDREGLQDAPQ